MIIKLKNGSGIHIKKKNRGKFTSYCGGNVTSACIARAKRSGNPTLVKRATFAANARKWKHQLGGNIRKIITTSGTGYIPDDNIVSTVENALVKGSNDIMHNIKTIGLKGINGWFNDGMVGLGYDNGVPENTFLLPRYLQEREFLKRGYIKGKLGDYGLVKKAVGKRKFPIYQRNPDAISKEKLIVLGNTYNDLLEPEYRLEDPGSAPTAVYTDGHGNFYLKLWDLNDYGGDGGSTASIAGKLLDFIGSPTVVTTGFQPLKKDYNPWFYPTLVPMMEKKGLVPTEVDGKTEWTLPEIVVEGDERKSKKLVKKHKDGGKLCLIKRS